MTCKKCKKESYFEELCQKHLKEYALKKIKKEIRIHQLFSPHDTFIVSHPFCETIVKEVVQGMPCTIKELGEGKEIVLWTMNDEIEQFLDAFFKNEPLPALGHEKNKIKLFLPLRDKEVAALASCFDISWTAPDRGAIGEMLENMSKDHPETEHSILKNIRELKKIFREKEEKT